MDGLGLQRNQIPTPLLPHNVWPDHPPASSATRRTLAHREGGGDSRGSFSSGGPEPRSSSGGPEGGSTPRPEQPGSKPVAAPEAVADHFKPPRSRGGGVPHPSRRRGASAQAWAGVELEPTSVYGVRIYHKGRWRWCLVDDFVPVDDMCAPRFIRSRSGRESLASCRARRVRSGMVLQDRGVSVQKRPGRQGR